MVHADAHDKRQPGAAAASSAQCERMRVDREVEASITTRAAHLDHHLVQQAWREGVHILLQIAVQPLKNKEKLAILVLNILQAAHMDKEGVGKEGKRQEMNDRRGARV